MNNPLFSFERIVKRLVEGAAGRLLDERRLAHRVATLLASAVEESAASGRFPGHYRVILHSDDFGALAGRADLLAAHLAVYVGNLARESGYSPGGEPFIDILEDSTVPSGEARVETVYDDDDTLMGQGMDQESPAGIAELDAFFIVNGRRHIPLDKPLMTIGRRMNNDIVVDSPAVSREHAQVRWRYGRFVLYDAGSRAGLRVNGEPAQEWVLRTGDLVTLVDGVSLIYGEGSEERDMAREPMDKEEQETLTFSRE